MHLRPRHIRGRNLFQNGTHELTAIAVEIGLAADERVFCPTDYLWKLSASDLMRGRPAGPLAGDFLLPPREARSSKSALSKGRAAVDDRLAFEALGVEVGAVTPSWVAPSMMPTMVSDEVTRRLPANH
jgi:hypothetical protein